MTYGVMSDKLTVTLIGPEVTARLMSSDKNGAATLSYSPGYRGYNDNKVITDS
jgi:hypothetical protein